MYELINVLTLLLRSLGPTPVAGFPGGTNAALLPEHAAPPHVLAVHTRAR